MDRRNSGVAWLFAAGLLAMLFLTRDSLLNSPAPPFSLPEMYGGRVDLSSYRGQPLLLVFWTTSCGICRAELPLVSRLAPEFRARGIAVAAIHLGGKSEARDYFREHRIALTALVDEDGATGSAYRVRAVPKSILIDDGGNILRSHSGMTGEQTLREWMNVARPVTR